MDAFTALTVNGDGATTSKTPGADRVGEVISVSVVIPCYNEERFIRRVLESLTGQYNENRYEIIVVDGMSTDGTRSVIADFAKRNPNLTVRMVENPARNIPTALNLGIREAKGQIVVRMDAHSIPSAGYVRRCVELLEQDQAAVVGMPWHIKPGAESLVARAIALAVAHPFGVGDAKYRLKNKVPQFVDTVPFGAFKKSLWVKVGGFDETLLTNEDYDFNYRVRRGGGKILLDVAEHSDYFARPDFNGLLAQYLRYGQWKAQMVKLYPGSLRLRQLVAPAFVFCLFFGILLSFLWPAAAWVPLLILALYAVLGTISAIALGIEAGDLQVVPVILLAFLAIHLGWGIGFLFGLLRDLRTANAAVQSSSQASEG